MSCRREYCEDGRQTLRIAEAVRDDVDYQPTHDIHSRNNSNPVDGRLVTIFIPILLACLAPFPPLHPATSPPFPTGGGSKTVVTQIVVHSKSADGSPDHHTPNTVTVPIKGVHANGTTCNGVVSVTLGGGSTPEQMAQALAEAIRDSMGGCVVKVEAFGNTVLVSGTDLASSEGTPDKPKKTPAPPPDPENGDDPFLTSATYERQV